MIRRRLNKLRLIGLRSVPEGLNEVCMFSRIVACIGMQAVEKNRVICGQQQP